MLQNGTVIPLFRFGYFMLFLYSKYGSVWDLFCDPSRATSLEDVS